MDQNQKYMNLVGEFFTLVDCRISHSNYIWIWNKAFAYLKEWIKQGRFWKQLQYWGKHWYENKRINPFCEEDKMLTYNGAPALISANDVAYIWRKSAMIETTTMSWPNNKWHLTWFNWKIKLQSQQPHTTLQAWGGVAGKLPGGKGPWGVRRQPAEYEPAVCPGAQEGQWHPGLYQE